uniref:Uncharacterized protein n=1 Tax=Chryseobacterium endophyticum TaxID=1854762 RepID=A0AAU6WTD4_9FLAO
MSGPAGSAFQIIRNLPRTQNPEAPAEGPVPGAAHPDDENTGLLSWLVNDQNLETGYLSLTRGDGGQNLLGTEQELP